MSRTHTMLLTLAALASAAILASPATPSANAGDVRAGFPIPPLSRTIQGETVSARTGSPVAGVFVTLSGGEIHLTARSDRFGQFAFDGLFPGTYLVSAEGGSSAYVTVSGFDSFVTLLVK